MAFDTIFVLVSCLMFCFGCVDCHELFVFFARKRGVATCNLQFSSNAYRSWLMRPLGWWIPLMVLPTSFIVRFGFAADVSFLQMVWQRELQAECCVLIGLAVQKRCVLGVCFIPKMDELLWAAWSFLCLESSFCWAFIRMDLGIWHLTFPPRLYTAIKGHGAFCNGRRISSSGCEDCCNKGGRSFSRHLGDSKKYHVKSLCGLKVVPRNAKHILYNICVNICSLLAARLLSRWMTLTDTCEAEHFSYHMVE